MNRYEQFRDLLKYIFPSEKIESFITHLDTLGYFTAPASVKYHGAYKGGLFDHSIAVTKNLLALTEKLNLEWNKESSPYIVGLFHDLCKCDLYIRNEDRTYSYNDDVILTGHGEKSVILIQQFYNLTQEEIMCIRWHMGAYDDSKVWSNLNAAIKRYPNVLWAHTADMIASQIQDI